MNKTQNNKKNNKKFSSKKKLLKVAKKWWLIAVIVLLFMGAATVAVIYTSPNTSAKRWSMMWTAPHNLDLPLCPEASAPNSLTAPSPKSKKVAFKPIRLVIEPWRGEHNVFAVFAVPLAYYDIYYRSIMQIEGSKEIWDATIADAKGMRILPPEGHFLMISFFPTRLTIWYWLTGNFHSLKEHCHWTLYIFPQ